MKAMKVIIIRFEDPYYNDMAASIIEAALMDSLDIGPIGWDIRIEDDVAASDRESSDEAGGGVNP